VLRVDLTKKRFWVEERPELFARGLGGRKQIRTGGNLRPAQHLPLPGAWAQLLLHSGSVVY
ncbi:MAG: hypothetical protein M1358_18260, partial [Chloroflexi bacterium]|nr:hypothetical protein [Chloroflexota bacterium]